MTDYRSSLVGKWRPIGAIPPKPNTTALERSRWRGGRYACAEGAHLCGGINLFRRGTKATLSLMFTSTRRSRFGSVLSSVTIQARTPSRKIAILLLSVSLVTYAIPFSPYKSSTAN
jgi:hypothetical protein